MKSILIKIGTGMHNWQLASCTFTTCFSMLTGMIWEDVGFFGFFFLHFIPSKNTDKIGET